MSEVKPGSSWMSPLYPLFCSADWKEVLVVKPNSVADEFCIMFSVRIR